MPCKYVHKTEFRHSEETRAKISLARKGHPVSVESRTKISLALQGEKNPNFGKHLTFEEKEKISLSKKKFFLAHPEFDNAHSRGKQKTAKQRQELSKIRRRYYKEHPEARRAISLFHTGLEQSSETRAKRSESHKQLWRNPEYATMKMKQYNAKPNNGEQTLLGILEEICPGQFKYNGDCSLGVVLNGYIPDFVNVNGKKQVVELFGEFWHRRPGRGEVEKIKRYEEIGWHCLVIWCNELKDTQSLEEKIRVFVGSAT